MQCAEHAAHAALTHTPGKKAGSAGADSWSSRCGSCGLTHTLQHGRAPRCGIGAAGTMRERALACALTLRERVIVQCIMVIMAGRCCISCRGRKRTTMRLPHKETHTGKCCHLVCCKSLHILHACLVMERGVPPRTRITCANQQILVLAARLALS